LWPLIDKRLAIVADARLSSRANQSGVAEGLLRISGEDSITIDRKFQRSWTGQLATRFAIMANELPRIADASGALASRFILLLLQRSFYGIEDHELSERLLKEVPGILNWSIAGWHRLQEHGWFRQPASGAEAIRELDDLGSPVGAFVREYCEIRAGLADWYDQIYDEWKRDCTVQGRNPGTAQSFGRALRAVVPGLKVDRPRLEDGRRVRRCLGIRLKRESQ
jgi:putative DNA primase/helicase